MKEAKDTLLMIISGVVGGVLGVIIDALYTNFNWSNFITVLLGIALMFETILLLFLVYKKK